MTDQGSRRPLKLILPKQGAERKTNTGGGKLTPFRDVNQELRTSLSNQLQNINNYFVANPDKTLLPIKTQLISKAFAKSHRPDKLFDDASCPITGAGKLGELFLKATPQGLKVLIERIESNETQKVVKDISTLESLEPITAAYRLRGMDSNSILERSPRHSQGFVVRVKLFDFGYHDAEDQFTKEFIALCEARNIEYNASHYSSDRTFSVVCKNTEDLDQLSNVVGIRSISSMPTIKVLRPKAAQNLNLPNLPMPSIPKENLPSVVIVDSGIDKQIPELSAFTVDRQEFVAKTYQNTDHGTFVAGLVCWGSVINPNLKNVNSTECAVVDVCVVPNDDPSHGPIETLTEENFLQALETSLKKYADTHKVWNLSIGTNEVCTEDEFSQLAVELDDLQERYQVTFVISAGNYDYLPQLDFPRIGSQLNHGRITSPADSVLGLSVGAVSHLDYPDDGPNLHEPSPFSRHGNGPNFIIKPDVVHFGGTNNLDKTHESGIRSITKSGLAEDSGTSFSTPLVSRALAQIDHYIQPRPNPVVAKAILVHHSRDPRTEDRVPDGDEKYFGFGMPDVVPECLNCSAHSSTLIFDDALRPGYFLEWNDFPYPPSLIKNGKFYGEIWMTIAFSPSRGSNWGLEYCQTHIDASFGLIKERTNRKTGEITNYFKGLVPPEHKNPGELFETFQIQQLRKWAPVRTYYGNLGEKGEKGLRWRLKVSLLCRHEIDKSVDFSNQPFSLIVTINDPTKAHPVYDEMAQVISSRYQYQNLTVRSQETVTVR